MGKSKSSPPRQPTTIVISKPVNTNPGKADPITNYKLVKGDTISIDLKSFGIDFLTNLNDINRAQLGFGSCRKAINQGALRPEAFLHQFKSGQLFFNANDSAPGLGDDGGLICLFKGGKLSSNYSYDLTGTTLNIPVI